MLLLFLPSPAKGAEPLKETSVGGNKGLSDDPSGGKRTNQPTWPRLVGWFSSTNVNPYRKAEGEKKGCLFRVPSLDVLGGG